MRTQDGFTLMDKSEVKDYLAKQKVTRTINKLQVHHMDAPSYSTWEKTDKKVFDEPHFGRTQSLNDYGRRTWGRGASDGEAHECGKHRNEQRLVRLCLFVGKARGIVKRKNADADSDYLNGESPDGRMSVVFRPSRRLPSSRMQRRMASRSTSW